MGQLHLLSRSPATGLGFPAVRHITVLDTWLPPASAAFYPLGTRSFSVHKKAVIFDARPGRFRFRMGRSDLTSDLELARPEDKRAPNKGVSGIFWILLLNIGSYVADHLFQIRQMKALYLYHSWPAWYQFVTATFCHANWNHLSSNLFFLYIFGAGANVVSWLVLPRVAVSVGASGAVFGLFAISVLVKMSWDWRKIIEVLILGQFVIEKVMEAAQASTGLAGPMARGYSFQTVNHIAHLSGALIGAALVLLISRIPSHPPSKDVKTLKADKDKRI
ncbi:rhomboid-like protein 11, chloroplastic isoform X2 [Typha latifolia]|uniref:rhomboid-like protein 11, chloroplastic isoform X2 n=1 Tax=Typha latifolia TaxID=4733 RepID=UPI003C2EAC94